MRLDVIFAAILLAGCAPKPAPVAQAKPDPTTEAWYGQAVEQLAGMNSEAAKLVEGGKPDEAASIVSNGQPIAARLLAPARPTLAAMEAASDLDQLYGRMLLGNRHYGWARLAFQKNADPLEDLEAADCRNAPPPETGASRHRGVRPSVGAVTLTRLFWASPLAGRSSARPRQSNLPDSAGRIAPPPSAPR